MCVVLWLSLLCGDPAGLHVVGVGKVSVEPDVGYIQLSVLTKDKESKKAIDTNRSIMNDLYVAFDNCGLKKSEIQTLNLQVYEEFKPISRKMDNGQYENENSRIGFVVNNSVRVTVCDFTKFGKILDAAIDGKATILSIQFGSTKSENKLDEARKLATQDARRKAKIIADGLNVELGEIVSAQEGVGDIERNSRYENTFRTAATATPVSGGSLEFTVTINVNWSIKNLK
jgi:uncharacterized protein YggE